MARTTPVNAGYTIINGTGTGSHGSRIDVWMEYKVISQDIPSNGTVLDVRFYTARVASASSNTKYDSGMNSTITVNGVAGTGVKNAAYDFSTTKVHDLGSWYGAIYHDADGSKSVSVSGSFTTRSSYISGGNISTTITLPTIPRASSVTTSGNEIGGELVVTITPAVSTFKHSLYLVFGTQTLTMASQTSDTVVRYTLPMDLINQFTNAEYGVGTVYCDTYNGSTMIGTSGRSVSLYAPASVIPTTEGVSVKDVGNTVPTGWGVYVQGKSKAEVSIDGASGVYGSSIRSYSIEGGGFSGATNPLVTGWLSSGDITFTAYATDSRGRKSEAKTASIYVHPYANPKLTNIQILRCDASGGESDDGEYISVYFDEEHSSCGGKNTAHTVLRYKSANSSSWASTADLVAGQANILSGFPTSASYDLELTISDAFTTVPYTDRLSAAERAININPSGKGVAIGKMSEKDAFEVAMDAEFSTRNVYAGGKLVLVDGDAAPAVYEYKGVNGVDCNAYTTDTKIFVMNGAIAPNANSHGFLDVKRYDGVGFVPVAGLGTTNPVVHQRFTQFQNLWTAYRSSIDGGTTWSEWEYDNPPLVAGVEYRTTERCNGRPIFKTLVAYNVTAQIGSTSTTTTHSIPHGISGFGQAIRVEAWKGNYLFPMLATNGGASNIQQVDATNIYMRLRNDYVGTGNMYISLAYIKTGI